VNVLASQQAPKLTIPEIQDLREMARAEADKGTVMFKTFWANLEQHERDLVVSLASDLKKRMSVADAALAQADERFT
jgi:hypothetical protein